MDTSTLGNRIKRYESAAESFLLPGLPVVVRLDGKNFSKFTRGMKRPFDHDFRQAMIEVAKYLLKETHAEIAYTQSDEISLVFRASTEKSKIFFDGRVQKTCSVLASMAASRFLLEALRLWPEKISTDGARLPCFDCRIFAVPNEMEAYNAILWREQDATKNSILMVAQTYFSHKECQGLDTRKLQEKLFSEKGINWNNFSPMEKRGVFVRKETVLKTLTPEILAKIPVDKQPADGIAVRSEIRVMNMPPIRKVSNILDVFFRGAQPICILYSL